MAVCSSVKYQTGCSSSIINNFIMVQVSSCSGANFIISTLLFALAKAINSLVSDSGTPSAIMATTLIVGCLRADLDEAAALETYTVM